MARVTIERTLGECENRFELVVLVSYRAHAIACGSSSIVECSNKYAVSALREVEAGKIDINELRNTVIRKYALENDRATANNSFVINDFSLRGDEDKLNTGKDDVRLGKAKTPSAYLDESEREVELNVSKDFFAKSDKSSSDKSNSK